MSTVSPSEPGAVWKCAGCGYENLAQDSVCESGCGAPRGDAPFYINPVVRDGKIVQVQKIVPCPDCGKEISSMANACPHCGRPSNPQGSALWALIKVIIGIVLLVALARIACA